VCIGCREFRPVLGWPLCDVAASRKGFCFVHVLRIIVTSFSRALPISESPMGQRELNSPHHIRSGLLCKLKRT